MKKSILIFIFLFCYFSSISVREISPGDIARWYLDSDLVLLGKVYKVDTVGIRLDTTWLSDNRIFVNTNAFEKYWIQVDSILKGHFIFDSLIVFTPLTRINCIGYYLDNPTESIKRFFINSDYYDDSWYTLSLGDRKIVMLEEKNDSFEVLYQMEINKTNLDFLDTVNVWSTDFWFHLPKREE